MPAPRTPPREEFRCCPLPDGVELHLLSTDRFRSVLVHWVAEQPLDEGRAARTLLTDLLTRGTAAYPSLARLAARCEELYGLDLFSSSSAHGALHLLSFGFETVADRWAEGRALFEQSVELLAGVLHAPDLVDGAFRDEHVAQERAHLVHAIEGLGDDKATWAWRRLVETMHAGTPYALHAWGTAEQARALVKSDVRRAHEALRAAPSRLFIVGDVDLDQARAAAERLSAGRRRPPPSAALAPPRSRPAGGVREVTEHQPLAQSKLALGHRVRRELLRGAAAPLFALAFGGESHSRLFKRVREAEGLAYGCHASLQLESATLGVQAGIDAGRAGRVRAAVAEELSRMAETPLSEDELELSRRAQCRRLRALADSPRSHVVFRLVARLNGRPEDPGEALAAVQAVTPAEVAAVAAGCTLDSAFLLEAAP